MFIKKAQVAQLVERNFEGVQVISSNLILGTQFNYEFKILTIKFQILKIKKSYTLYL